MMFFPGAAANNAETSAHVTWEEQCIDHGGWWEPGKLQINKGRVSALLNLDLTFLGGWCGEVAAWGKGIDLHTGKAL